MIKNFFLYLLKIYQKFFTLIGYGSCRYYPTCSEYAKWQIEKNNIIKALVFTTIRILKCNQLFDGGIDYPIIRLKLNNSKLKQNTTNNLKKIKYWFVPIDIKKPYAGKYYMVKTLNR